MTSCPSCGAPVTAEIARCASCETPLVVAGHQIEALLSSTVSEVDNAGQLFLASKDRRQRLVRVARTGEGGRLRREQTVLNGIEGPGVPKVVQASTIDGLGEVLIMDGLRGEPLSLALERGALRTDARGARQFLRATLLTLERLSALSPAVYHRAVSPQTMAWDGNDEVTLFDFSRATDVAADISGDIVVPEIGYAPPRSTTAAVRDLYGLAATTIHLLARVHPGELERDGKIAFADAVTVDDALTTYLNRLLDGEFECARDARIALDQLDIPVERSSVPRAALFVPIAGAAVLVGVVVFALIGRSTEQVNSAPSPEPPRATLTVDSTPSGASVVRGDERIGRTPLSIEVDKPSSLELTVRLEGYHSATRTIDVTADTHLSFAMRKTAVKPVQPGARTPVRPVKKPRPPAYTPPSNADILRAIERAVRKEQGAIAACHAPGVDRVKFHVVLKGQGKLTKLRALGSGATRAGRCVESVLGSKVAYPSTSGGREVSADVWVWLAPFKVAAF